MYRLANEVHDRAEQVALRMTNMTRVSVHVKDVQRKLEDLVSHAVNVSNNSANAMVTNKRNKEKVYVLKVPQTYCI